MKVIIDSNVFIVCLNPLSKYNAIFTNLLKGLYKLCISTDISFEYKEIFNQKFQKAKAEAVGRFLVESDHVIHTEIHYNWRLITVDPDDNKFIDCAVAANANYLVSNDRHFNILKEIDFPKVNCITIEEFMEVLKNL